MPLANLLSSLGKVLIASFITGTVLTMLGLNMADIFPAAADMLDQVTDTVEVAINWLVIWSLPNIMIGAIVIVPVWLVLIIFGPKSS